jgi:hypothetical protein
VKWQSFATAEAAIDTWEITPTGAVALMDEGKTAEVRLKNFQGMTDEPVVIRNLGCAPDVEGLRSLIQPRDASGQPAGGRHLKRTRRGRAGRP